MFQNGEKWAYVPNRKQFASFSSVRFPHLISLTFLERRLRKFHIFLISVQIFLHLPTTIMFYYDVPKVFIDFEASFSNQVLDDGSVGEKPNVHINDIIRERDINTSPSTLQLGSQKSFNHQALFELATSFIICWKFPLISQFPNFIHLWPPTHSQV